MNRFKNSKWCFVVFPIIGAAFLALVSLIVMLLWNYTLPGIFQLPVITFWQALGIFLLCKILFGFGKGKGGPPWANRGRQRAFGRFSEQEKEQFRTYMQDRMCNWSRYKEREGQYKKEDKEEDKTV